MFALHSPDWLLVALLALTSGFVQAWSDTDKPLQSFHVELKGVTEAQTADRQATGKLSLDIFKPGDYYKLEYTFEAYNLTAPLPPLFQHIHKGSSAQVGPPVLVFTGLWSQKFDANSLLWTMQSTILNTNNLSNQFNMTYTQVIDDVIANCLNYYINVHTPVYINGAIRGQMA